MFKKISPNIQSKSSSDDDDEDLCDFQSSKSVPDQSYITIQP